MKTDKYGNIIIAGKTEEGNVDFDPGPGIFTGSNPNGGMFICKLSNDGNLIQVERFGAQVANSIEIDAFDNIIVAGTENYDISILKVDKNLKLLWEKRILSTNRNPGENNVSVKTDASGNMYFVAIFSGTIDADPGTGVFKLTSTGTQDFFLIKLTPSGSFIFAKSVGGWPLLVCHFPGN